MDAVVKLEEYKLFSELVQHLSERRQTASQTYLAVNTAAFGVLAFLAKDAGFHGWGLVGVSVPLFFVGIIACVIWHKIVTHFREIIGWHYQQLRDMEEALPESARIYSLEFERFYLAQAGKRGFSFSQLEIWLPRLFIALYAIYAMGIVVATALGWV
jgi:hypothetical protein